MITRTLKYSLAACVAVVIAQCWGLVNPVTAGIIALLSLTDSRRSTLKLARERGISICLALGLAWVLLSLIDAQLLMLALFLIISVPLFSYFGLGTGLVPSTVLVTQLMAQQQWGVPQLVNQLVLFVIGAGCAFVANSYMPSRNRQIRQLQADVEYQMQQVFSQMEQSLRGGGTLLSHPTCLEQLNQTVESGLEMVIKDRDNQLFTQLNYHLRYFEMRQAQARLLTQMVEGFRPLGLSSQESKRLAGLFYLAGQQLSEYNPALYLMADIEQLTQYYRERPLPQTREEFEHRAGLFQLLNDFTRVIQLKVDFYLAYQAQWQAEQNT